MVASMATVLARHNWDGPHWWFVFFPLIPLFWITLFVVVIAFVRRRVGGPWRGHWQAGSQAGPSPESVLGERYARGEIDEAEYRSRLEVLRSGRR